MDWVKRNLYFLIGAALAFVLMGVAGWYLYSKWQLNNANLAKLEADFAELDRLSKENPHPGDGKNVDNIAEAKNQQRQLRQFIQNGGKYFLRIPPIPDVPKVMDHDLSTALSHTVDKLRKDATNASVTLQHGYDFSFQAEKNLVSFPAGSHDPLATQLGEVKAICEVLFRAKINSLDGLQRERVCAEDEKGNQSDYLTVKTATNELALLTPYQLTFRCFSPELGSVLAGFASSPHALLVKSINVEHAGQTPAATDTTAAPAPPPPVVFQPVPPPVPVRPESEQAAFARRYGLDRGGGPRAPQSYAPQPVYPQPVYPATGLQPGTPGAAGGKGTLPVVVDEVPLRVTMMLNVVKLTTPKAK